MAVTPVRLIDSTKGAEEKLVGKNSPTLPDVLNRPLQDVLSGSGYKTDGTDFAGMAKTAHTHLTADVTDFLSTGSPTATDANASATDFVFTSLGGVLRRLGLSSLAKWLNARRGIYSVVDFGADPTGVADSTTALQNCADTAGANATILVPPGDYHHTGLKFQSGQTWRATAKGSQANAGQSKLTFTGASGSAFAPKTPAANTVNLHLEGLTIDGSTGADVALDLTRTSYSSFSDCYFNASKASATAALLDAQTSSQCYFNLFLNCRFEAGGGASQAVGGTGVLLANGANANTFIGGKLANCMGYSVNFSNLSSGNVFVNVEMEGVSGQTIHINLPSGCSRNTFYSPHMEVAATGFQIASGCSYTGIFNPTWASNITTRISNASNLDVGNYIDTDDTTYLNSGYFRLKQSNNGTSTTCFIDPTTAVGTANANTYFYSRVSTSGARKVIWCVGNGTTTATMQMDLAAGQFLSYGAAGGIGYGTGAGGTVAQATSKATGVTLNRVTGEITLNAAALAAGVTVSFVLSDTAIAAGDYVHVQHVSGGTLGAYDCQATAAAGSATIYVTNRSAGSLAEAIVVKFFVAKAATA